MTSMNASLTFKELRYVTDVPVYVTKSAANVIAFTASLVVTICLGFYGLGRDVKGNAMEINDEFPTVISPRFWTFSVWVVIFVMQGAFVFAQSLKPFRDLPIVQDGIIYNLFLIHCFHIGWVVSYVFRSIPVATGFMAMCVLFLLKLSVAIYDFKYEPASEGATEAQQPRGIEISTEHLLFKLPFHLHLGSAMVVLVVNINQLFLFYDWTWISHSTLAISSLFAFWLIGTFSLFFLRKPNFTVPLAIAWGVMGIWSALSPLTNDLKEEFGRRLVFQIRNGAIVICLEHLVFTIVRFIFHYEYNEYIQPQPAQHQRVSTIANF